VVFFRLARLWVARHSVPGHSPTASTALYQPGEEFSEYGVPERTKPARSTLTAVNARSFTAATNRIQLCMLQPAPANRLREPVRASSGPQVDARSHRARPTKCRW